MANGSNKQKGSSATPQQKAKAERNPAKDQVERLFGRGIGDAVITLPADQDPNETEGNSAKAAKNAIEEILNSLGTEVLPATQFPVPKNRNNGPAAAAFILWDHVSKFADKRFKEASKDAEEQGVFGNPLDYESGETKMVYSSPEFAISIKKGNDSALINRELVEEVLREIAPGRWQELLKRCMKPRAGPVQRIVSLK